MSENRNIPAVQGAPIETAQRMEEAMQMEMPAIRKMTEEKLHKAKETLNKYITGKALMDKRMVENEKWWVGRAWNHMQNTGNPYLAQRPTMWLFNVVLGKHADMMAGYPEPVILPREENDKDEAKMLTDILPVVLEQNEYKRTYNAQAWKKNKSGLTVTGVLWDAKKLNGLGDINISVVDPTRIFWEPGILDIQQSENVFVISMENKNQLLSAYPQLQGKMPTHDTYNVQEYSTDDKHVKDENKTAVVDWYYHTYKDGMPILQYCKFCGEVVLYASEDDPEVKNGWYTDGEYPFVVDILFPIEGTLDGLGYVDIGKGTQETIDLLDQAIAVNAIAGALPRFMSNEDSGVNGKDFMDFTKMWVKVEGQLDDLHVKQIKMPELPGSVVTVLGNKIEELKQVLGNQDVNNGSSGGVTAAAGIAALMEAAGRSSQDGIRGTYDAYSRILKMVIERIRQFYDMPRTFRITGKGTEDQYARYNNAGLQMQPMDIPGYEHMMRKPVFDIKVDAQKQNAYSKMAQNELMFQLLNAGVFNLQMIDQSLMLLEGMDFNGKDEIMRKLQEMGGMQQELAMYKQMLMQLAQQVDPALAEQISQMIMAQSGAPMPMQAGADMKLPAETQESGVTRDAREMAAEASQVQ